MKWVPLSEEAARAVDEALRARAAQMEKLSRDLDDRTQKPDGYHPNSLTWFSEESSRLRRDAGALRGLGRFVLHVALNGESE